VSFLDQVQFFRFFKGRCHGNHFCFIPDLFARSQSISGFAGPIFTIFAPYGIIQLKRINLIFFFSDILRDVVMATNQNRKIIFFYGPIYFVVLPFGKWLQYHNSDFKKLHRMNISTSSSQELLVGSSPNFQGLVKQRKGWINFAFICSQTMEFAKLAFFAEKSSLSRCHSEMDWNIRTPVGSLEAHWMWLRARCTIHT